MRSMRVTSTPWPIWPGVSSRLSSRLVQRGCGDHLHALAAVAFHGRVGHVVPDGLEALRGGDETRACRARWGRMWTARLPPTASDRPGPRRSRSSACPGANRSCPCGRGRPPPGSCSGCRRASPRSSAACPWPSSAAATAIRRPRQLSSSSDPRIVRKRGQDGGHRASPAGRSSDSRSDTNCSSRAASASSMLRAKRSMLSAIARLGPQFFCWKDSRRRSTSRELGKELRLPVHAVLQRPHEGIRPLIHLHALHSSFLPSMSEELSFP